MTLMSKDEQLEQYLDRAEQSAAYAEDFQDVGNAILYLLEAIRLLKSE